MNDSEKIGLRARWQNLGPHLLGTLRRFNALSLKRRHSRSLLTFVLMLLALIAVFTVGFKLLMEFEGQDHSWVSGFYWAITTMSTLGYGDITFTSDIGRLYSMLVLLSGMLFLLVLLPFTFIELFYVPWVEARAASRVPRSAPADIKGHVILTDYDPVSSALIEKLTHFNYPYVVILPEFEAVENLVDQGIQAMHGELDDPDTYRRARVEHAELLATTRTDVVNTSVTFTVRGITEKIRVIATARESASTEVLRLAGCRRVLDLSRLMAEALARRVISGDRFTHVVGQIDDLLIAEVIASRTTLVGWDYRRAQRETSVSIVGFWERGNFQIGQPENIIEANSVLVLAGSRQQLDEFDANYQAESAPASPNPVIIIGGGRVGRATGAALKRRGIEYRIVEQQRERILNSENYIHGSAADKAVLQQAEIDSAPTVIITPRDDETNIYLTIFCRLLRDDIQIISRSTLERNVATLHRAGSDIVMSYASMGANSLFNLLQRSDLLLVAEGLDVFKVPVPAELAGKSLADANIRQRSRCTVIGIDYQDRTTTNPGPDTILPENGEIVLIGTPAGEAEFLALFKIEQ